MARLSSFLWVVLLAALLIGCDTATPPTLIAPAATDTPPAATATAVRLPATASLAPTVPPTATAPPASPTVDPLAASAYATLTALAGNEAATATAAALPTVPPTASAAPPVPAAALGTYRLIVTARAEGLRVFREAGTLVISKPQPGSNHSAEIQFAHGVRVGREFADLSPGPVVGGIYLASSTALLPEGFPKKTVYNVSVVYNPATKYLNIVADPARGIPGGWSTGPNNKARVPRPITAGTIEIDLGTAGQAAGQFDLRSTAGSVTVLYNGGFEGTKR